MALLLTASAFSLPRLFGYEVYAVISGSMAPYYPIGAIIFTHRENPAYIQEGDCITYLYGKSTVTHRVLIINSEDRIFITKGDANTTADPPVSFDRLVGRAGNICIPLLGYPAIWLRKERAVYFTIPVLCLVMAILLVCRTPFRRIWRLKRNEKEYKNAH